MHLADRVAIACPVDVHRHVVAVRLEPAADAERLAYLLVRWVGRRELVWRAGVVDLYRKLHLVPPVKAVAVVDLVPVVGVAEHVVRAKLPYRGDRLGCCHVRLLCLVLVTPDAFPGISAGAHQWGCRRITLRS